MGLDIPSAVCSQPLRSAFARAARLIAIREALRSVWQQKAFERSIAFESNDSFVAEWTDYSRRLREIVGGAGGDE